MGDPSSAEIFQLLLQLLSGEEDAALYGAQWKTHLFGYLAVFESGNVHGEGDAVFLGQGVDDAAHFLEVIGSFGAFKRRFVLRQVQVVVVVGRVDKCLFADDAAVVVDEDVAHNGVYPALEVSLGFILFFIVQSLE